MMVGSLVGVYFDQLPPLKAYAADLGGSLAGVIAMAIVAAFWAPPPVWIALGALPLLWILRDVEHARGSGRDRCAAVFRSPVRVSRRTTGSIFSPRDDTLGAGPQRQRVDAQRQSRLSPEAARPASSVLGGEDTVREYIREVYELPFSFTSGTKRSALIVGAGTGNDVAAALRRGFDPVVAIDIDPAILSDRRRASSRTPLFGSARATVTDDARAYFGRRRSEGRRFDVVCYGLLDSHAMFSSMSSLRLDNFVYTEEGLAAAWAHVADDGVLSVSFSVFAGDWMYQRILGLVRNATGIDPIVVRHGYDAGATFLVGRHLTLARAQAVLPIPRRRPRRTSPRSAFPASELAVPLSAPGYVTVDVPHRCSSSSR